MALEILLPELGFSMNEGQPLYLLESDKSTNGVEAPSSETLRIVAEIGETCEVGTVLGTIE